MRKTSFERFSTNSTHYENYSENQFEQKRTVATSGL